MVDARNHVLIDYENVQPRTLAALRGPAFRVLVFVGAGQARISIDVAEALHALGPDARYIRCSGNGSNALDFHIAFYIGELASQTPGDVFHIVSKDTGFDPLVTHLRARGLQVSRVPSVESLPMLRAALPKAPKVATVKAAATAAAAVTPIERVVAALRKQGAARPGSPKTLQNAIGAIYQGAMPAAERARLVQQLQQRGWVKVVGSKVTYALPG
ncbi:NYN domain-containing protein [Bacillus subtilis subsp. subtilis]|nr:NYN domain-containing protein [Bacillus subtilis subsp. subtilis]